MINLINEIKNLQKEVKIKVELNNKSLLTKITCYSPLCANKVSEFALAFNTLFKNNETNSNCLNVEIIENDEIFQKALIKLEDTSLIQTKATEAFNKATITTSISKCSSDKNYYILRCYDYFIYIFDKTTNSCYMLIKNNKKAITMVNILLLTPYLMYGELYAVHGGLVNKNNENILINNSSLGGKTTFAILFATNDWNIITEETTYITRSGNILPYNIRNYFNIRAGTYLAFKDYFISKNIINEKFLALENKSKNELFDLGKDSQFSIYFEDIGKSIQLENNKISHSLKVSIEKDQKLEIKPCSPIENVNSFLELSLAPTVLLFTELLDFNDINKKERTDELTKIFEKTNSYILKSGFDYRENYNRILKEINL